MKMKNEALVGVVVLAGIMTALVGSLWLSGQTWGAQQQDLVATFREVGALERGNPVKYRGVNVGRVTDIALSSRGDGVFVTLAVRPDVVLPADAGVLLSAESVFGGYMAQLVSMSQFPDLQFTSPQRADVLAGASLPDFTELTAVAARIASDMETLSDRVQLAFTPETAVKIREIVDNAAEISQQLGGFIDQQTRTYGDVSTNVLASTENIRVATAEAQATMGDLRAAFETGEVRQVLANAQRASANLAAFSEQLDALGAGFPGLMTQAQTTLGTFGQTAASFDQTLQSLQPAFAEVAPTIVEAREAMTTLNRTMQAMQEGDGTIGRLLTDPALYEETQRAVATMQRLLADVQANPGKYIRNLRIF
jgi:phospholipid/cholesterol/gamma-HCH transport system substrate-binding protein